jgi:hypothetical protein
MTFGVLEARFDPRTRMFDILEPSSPFTGPPRLLLSERVDLQ